MNRTAQRITNAAHQILLVLLFLGYLLAGHLFGCVVEAFFGLAGPDAAEIAANGHVVSVLVAGAYGVRRCWTGRRVVR